MRLTATLLLPCLLLAQVTLPSRAWGAPVDPPIPQTPTAPPTLGAKGPQDVFLCQRAYRYRGKILPCDSNVAFDGENLRPILIQAPGSVELLDRYQENRRKVNRLAYTATAGLVLILLGNFVSKGYEDPTRTTIRNVGAISGLVLTTGSFVYGVTLLNSNEAYLREAVRTYNQARPQDPIELQLGTTVRF